MVTKVNVNMLPIGTGALQLVQIGSDGKLPALDASNLINIGASSLEGFDITSPIAGDILHYDGENFVNGQPGNLTGVQPYDADLTVIAGLSHVSNGFLLSNGTNWSVSSGSSARSAIGLGTADTPLFTGMVIGNTSAKTISSSYILRNSTTDATITELFLDGVSSKLTMANNSTWGFDIIVAARRTDATGDSAKFSIDGVVSRDANAASTILIGDPEINIDSTDQDWNVTVDADATSGNLRIRVQGEAGKTIKWVAYVRTAEVTN